MTERVRIDCNGEIWRIVKGRHDVPLYCPFTHTVTRCCDRCALFRVVGGALLLCKDARYPDVIDERYDETK